MQPFSRARPICLIRSNFQPFTTQRQETDLTLGLPKNHVWESAGAVNAQGEEFLPNMPTEEVFTAPDFRRADGYVTSTKPLS
ncbi:aminopeptidase [Streptococcus pneumoniae]|uniref:aminopeptidase n=1 Tax=Streptococcus pneumoniae TaxID=1313 RepID=UPI004035FC0B